MCWWRVLESNRVVGAACLSCLNTPARTKHRTCSGCWRGSFRFFCGNGAVLRWVLCKALRQNVCFCFFLFCRRNVKLFVQSDIFDEQKFLRWVSVGHQIATLRWLLLPAERWLRTHPRILVSSWKHGHRHLSLHLSDSTRRFPFRIYISMYLIFINICMCVLW